MRVHLWDLENLQIFDSCINLALQIELKTTNSVRFDSEKEWGSYFNSFSALHARMAYFFT